ncbi:MAG TPA: hypothetical protein VGH57_01250 [Amycolatopsis sp.]|jgi:hypothetical protein
MTEPEPVDESAPDTASPEPAAAETPSAAAGVPDGAGPEDTPADGQEDIGSAQNKAADPEQAESWRLFTRQMETATVSMFGSAAGGAGPAGGTANFFLGATNVGQVGDRHSRPRDLRVRSGVVSAAMLERIEQSYVEPDGYPELKATLARELVLLIRARGGTGRTTTALRLLDEACREGVRKLDPDTDLKSLQAKDFEPSRGYLLESLDPAQAAELKAFHAESLSRLMQERGCMLVVIVDESTALALNEVGHLVVEDFGMVKPERLLHHYVQLGLRDSGAAADADVLTRPAVKEIIDQLTEDMPARELAELGELLVEVANDRRELDYVRERYSRASSTSFGEWFETQQEVEQRAFVIALAVLNGESVQLVSAAATMLADRFLKLEFPKRADRSRDVFATPLARRLQQARAEVVTGTQDTRFGQVRVHKAQFRDERFPLRVLEQVRSQYTQALEVVMGWLFDLGNIPGPQVRIRAGVAAGYLSQHDFVDVYHRILWPWAASGDEDQRQAAIAALQVPGWPAGSERVVSKLLTRWVRQRHDRDLQATAARALGSTTAMSPATALRLLRLAARHADWDVAFSIGESVSDLFRADSAQVLAALVRWSREDEFPQRRETALLAVLITSRYLAVTEEHSSEHWPVLVWLAERRPQEREPIVLLFSRMLLAADFMRHGYLEIHRWLRLAQREPALVEPIARLLAEVGRHSGETDSIEFYLRDWAGDRGAPAQGAGAVLEQFVREQEGTTEENEENP